MKTQSLMPMIKTGPPISLEGFAVGTEQTVEHPVDGEAA
jgi:hypothetical protein